MGFETAAQFNTSTPAAGVLATSARNGSLGGGTLTGTLPANIRDGDLVFAWFTSGGSGTTAWTTPSGWTLVGTQKDGTSSFGGRSALFKKVWRTGDPTTVASSNGTGESHCDIIVVRSDTDGASLTVNNFAENEGTVSSTTLVMPRANPTSKYDLRLFFARYTGAGLGLTPATPAVNADNQFQAAPQTIMINGVGGGGSSISPGFWSDPTGTDAGTTNWTMSFTGKYYAIAVTINDPNATENGMTAGAEDQELLGLMIPVGTGVEHATIQQSGGNGGGIAVGL